MNARGKKRVCIKIALHLQALSLVRERDQKTETEEEISSILHFHRKN